MSGATERRLVIFGKVPEPGRVKTRLAPALGEERAARLYRAFLDDTVRAATRVSAERRELWVAAGTEEPDDLAERYPRVAVRRQPTGDLGAKMAAAFEAAFGEGSRRVLVVGSDHPTLPHEYLQQALDGLEEADLTLGPTADGGYWGLGLRAGTWPAARSLFRDVPWSTPDVLDATRRRSDRLGLHRLEVGAWYDVDDPDDLGRLRRDAPEASATARVLRGTVLGDRTGRGEGSDGG